MEVAGPFPGGHYFGVVPQDTTVSASGDEVVLLQHPHGRELKEFKASGKDKYVFFKSKGKKCKKGELIWKWSVFVLGDQTNLKKMVNLKVNGKERTLEAGIRKG